MVKAAGFSLMVFTYSVDQTRPSSFPRRDPRPVQVKETVQHGALRIINKQDDPVLEKTSASYWNLRRWRRTMSRLAIGRIDKHEVTLPSPAADSRRQP